MSTIVPNSRRIKNKQVVELRYGLGHIYWDRCGRIINEVLSGSPEWAFDSMKSGHCVMTRMDQNLQFVFGYGTLHLMQTQDVRVTDLLPVKDFAEIAESLAQIVIRVLELREFTRLGFRVWHMFETPSRYDANQAIARLKHFQFSERWGKVIAPTFSVEIEQPSRMLRVNLSSFEQEIRISPNLERNERIQAKNLPTGQREARIEKLKAKYKVESFPQCGVLVDIDGWIEDPLMDGGVSISSFAVDTFEEVGRVEKELLEEN